MKPITDILFIVGGKAKCFAVPMIFIKIVWSVIEKMWQGKKESKIKEKKQQRKDKKIFCWNGRPIDRWKGVVVLTSLP